MRFHRLIAVSYDSLACQQQVPYRFLVGRALAIVCFALLLGAAQTSWAAILVTGNVTPADNPFTTGVNEGLPTDGNFVNPFEDPDHQTYFEGRHTDGANAADIADDTNENFNIFVGTTSSGTLLISGESALRDMNLVIGDSGLVNNVLRRGTGVVRITGFGSLYNNNFDIIPDGLPADFASQSPRSSASAADGLNGPTDGFDLYVGRGGTGTLEISAGARGEIQDAVVVADTPTSTGSIIVDGFDSFLGNGGFTSGNALGGAPHAMLVGRQGVGYLTITNGGTVQSDAFVGSTPIGGAVGAVIGSDAFNGFQGEVQPRAGGVGTVTVDGNASKWIVGGTLQVGGFSATHGTPPPNLFFDPIGEDLLYNNETGRGTLYVQNGGLVNVVNALQITNNDDPDLTLAIGQFGRVYLNGGQINVGGTPGGANQENDARNLTVRVINDGIISGSGKITTGTFLNRYLGQVQVNAGQNLTIDSAADFIAAAPSEPKPLTNFGRIEVNGTVDSRAELSFVRHYSNPVVIDQPFYNIPLPAGTVVVPPAFDGGQISAQHATLRFGSGIQNHGVMAFTAGENIVSGQINNVADASNNGRFFIAANTTVHVEDDFASGGLVEAAPVDFPILTLREGSRLNVLNHKSFTLEGHLDMELSHTNPAKIEVAGDVGLNANLYVSFDNNTLGSLSHGDTFELIYFAGFIGGVNHTDPAHLTPDLTTNPVLNVVLDPMISLLYPNLDLFAVRVLQSYYLFALDPSMIGSGGAVGPDFNGDGVINADDLAIWQANVGCETACSVLQGDADGDGDVDGDDFLFWQRNVGQPMPWTGSGSAAAVPEPTTAVLLVIGMLSLPAWRRRSAS